MRRLPPDAPWLAGSRGSRSARDAFTLIELLVVAAIIAMLIAILVPSLKSARDRAKAAVCLSNLRQMGIAAQMYGMDYQEQLPPSDCPHAQSPEESWWLNSLQPYSRTKLLYRCPMDRSTNFLDRNQPPPKDEWDDYRWASFATNGMLDDPNWNSPAKVKYPAYVIWVCETPENTSKTLHIHPDLWDSPKQAQNDIAYKRHSSRSHYLFVDAHVAPLKIEQTWDPFKTSLWCPWKAPAWWHPLSP
jgi:prepilin-type N-terminal cleavage/methylation domain-containing protein/prepilin-type processing-associated H-X9-DG protein